MYRTHEVLKWIKELQGEQKANPTMPLPDIIIVLTRGKHTLYPSQMRFHVRLVTRLTE